MLNNKDPLIGAVQEIMKKNQAERDAVRLVNEKFGISDRRALPLEQQANWDAAYKTVLSEGVEALDEKLVGKQKNIDVASSTGEKKPDGKLTKHDFEHLRSMKEEGDPSKAIRGDDVTGGSSVTTVPSKPTSITPTQQSALKKKIQSIKEAKKAMCEGTLEEKAPPGREDQVKALKKKFPKGSGSPFAIAWSSYKKSKKLEEATLESIQEEIANNLAEQAASIFESEGHEGLINFMESLSEEQISILQEAGWWDSINSAVKSATGAANAYLNRKAADAATAVLGPERSASLQSFVKGSPVGVERKQEMQKGNMPASEYKAGPQDPRDAAKPKPKPVAPKATAPVAPKATAPAAPVKKSTPVTRMKHNRSIDKNNEVGPGAKYQGLGVTTGTTVKK